MKRALLITAVVLLLVGMIGLAARADYVLALHWPKEQCFPCARMLPVEAALRAEGCDIRAVDITAHPKFASAPGHGVPRYVYVVERGAQSYYTNAVIVGECSAGQLRRFCVVPGVVTIGAAARNVVVNALISPRWMFAPIPYVQLGPVQ